MWIIILKSILALVSIFTGGAIFYKYIKDNKILVFLAGSISILSAVYLFSEIKKDIDKIIVEKKVEVKVEEKKEEVVVEKKEVRNTSSSKWITPSNSTCKNNGGKIDSVGCNATWENAKNICSASGGSLASIDVLRKVVTDCGGKIDDYNNNIDNRSYQSCFKEKGFRSSNYWSSTSVVGFEYHAWIVGFDYGVVYGDDKNYNVYVRCVRDGQ